MFQINNVIWHIKFVDSYHPILQRANGEYSVGCCNNFDKTIYLSEALHGAFLKKVLTHEISHAAIYSYNVILPIALEEEVADLIATYGHEIIQLSDIIYNNIKKDRYQK